MYLSAIISMACVCSSDWMNWKYFFWYYKQNCHNWIVCICLPFQTTCMFLCTVYFNCIKQIRPNLCHILSLAQGCLCKRRILVASFEFQFYLVVDVAELHLEYSAKVNSTLTSCVTSRCFVRTTVYYGGSWIASEIEDNHVAIVTCRCSADALTPGRTSAGTVIMKSNFR